MSKENRPKVGLAPQANRAQAEQTMLKAYREVPGLFSSIHPLLHLDGFTTEDLSDLNTAITLAEVLCGKTIGGAFRGAYGRGLFILSQPYIFVGARNIGDVGKEFAGEARVKIGLAMGTRDEIHADVVFEKFGYRPDDWLPPISDSEPYQWGSVQAWRIKSPVIGVKGLVNGPMQELFNAKAGTGLDAEHLLSGLSTVERLQHETVQAHLSAMVQVQRPTVDWYGEQEYIGENPMVDHEMIIGILGEGQRDPREVFSELGSRMQQSAFSTSRETLEKGRLILKDS